MATDSVDSSGTTLCIITDLSRLESRLESSQLIESESTDSLLPTLLVPVILAPHLGRQEELAAVDGRGGEGPADLGGNSIKEK